MKTKIYFAHPMSHYNTPLEKKCIEILRYDFPGTGLTILNPNAKKHAKAYKKIGFRYFHDLAQSCDAVAAVPFRNDSFGMGVFGEMQAAFNNGKDVYVFDYEMKGWKILPRAKFEAIVPLSIAVTRALVRAGVE